MISLKDAIELLAKIPNSEIHQARLALAEDQMVALEKENGALKAEVAVLKTKLEQMTANYEEKCRDYDQLAKEHEEDVVLLNGVEFRRGKRTLRRWIPFCGLCHNPAIVQKDGKIISCTDTKCTWNWVMLKFDLQASLEQLPTEV